MLNYDVREADYLNHRRSRYLHFAFFILHFALKIPLGFFHNPCGMWKTFLWKTGGQKSPLNPLGKRFGYPHWGCGKKPVAIRQKNPLFHNPQAQQQKQQQIPIKIYILFFYITKRSFRYAFYL